MLSKLISEVGINKRNQKVRKQENNNSNDKAIKKTKKKERKQELNQDKKKSFVFYHFLGRVLSIFLF